MKRRGLRDAATLGALVALAGCSVAPLSATPGPRAAVPNHIAIDCGPITVPALCERAAETAAWVKLNAPPIAGVAIRRPMPNDECTGWESPCDQTAVIVTIHSGDTLQAVPMRQVGDGWVVLEAPR